MLDRPSGAALLEAARRSLLEEVAPALKGQPRYVALMVANAIGVVAREISEGGRSERAWDAVLAEANRQDGETVEASLTRLVGSIRAGAHDADAALYRALIETAEVGAAIWKPDKPA